MIKADEQLLICRVCTTKVDSRLKCYNIFEKYEDILSSGTSTTDILISDKLTACADVKIKRDDRLPNRICSSCLLELDDAYNFRRKCEKSDEILRTALNTKVTNHQEVSVKVENPSDSENNVFDDDAASLQSEDIILKHEREDSPSGTDYKLDNLSEQQPDDNISLDVQADSNNSKNSINLILKCHDCGQIFKSKCKLRVHIKKEHSHLPVSCTSCKHLFKSFRAFHKHQKFSPKSCISLSKFRIEGTGNSRHFYCKGCQYNSKHVKYALNHLVVHDQICQYKCDQCDKMFVRIVSLRGHKERVHKQFYGQKTCHICGKFFLGFTAFDSHMNTHRKKRVHCDICNKYFSSRSNLHTHKKTHSDLRPFKCEKCPAKFSTSAGLYSHKYVHIEKNLSCKICGYKVKRVISLKKHEDEHNPGNVACGDCGKFFVTDTQLDLHMKSHVKPHPCEYCNKTYTARKNLTEHLRKSHKIYVSSSDFKGNLKLKKIT